MRQLLKKLFGQVKNQLTSGSRPRRGGVAGERRLRMESLEDRRVLATVTAFTPTASGFNLQLSEQVNTVNLNLYDTESAALGPADVILRGATVGNVNGSMLVQGTSLVFVATGGPLVADTYTVTLRSAANAFTDLADGDLLDGENNGALPSGNGTPGGDFVTTFTVTGSQSLVVGLPDFVRGPSQPVNAPSLGSGTSLPSGLPIQLSNAAGVTTLTLTLAYNQATLNVTDVVLGADAPSGSQVEANFDVPGQVTIAFFSLQPLTATQTDIVNLVATVPANAPYGSISALTISGLEVNAGTLAARADDAIHVIAFPGDANANRRYDAEDARLIARVGVGLDTGFVINQPTGPATSTTDRLFPTIDPVLIGDVTGVDGISPLDASDVLRRVVGLVTPNIPALPSTQAPTAIALSNSTIAQSTAIGSSVGTLTTTDADVGDTHTYSLVAGQGATDNTAFTIAGNMLIAATTFNASVQSTYNLRVQTSDSTGRTFQMAFVLTVTASNVAPTAIALSNASIAENSPDGTVVGTLTTTDTNAGDTHTYSLVTGTGSTDNATFRIVGGALQAAAGLDFEARPNYSVRVRSTDNGGLFTEQAFTINVTNVNEVATAVTLSATAVPDDSQIGTVVGTLGNNDPDAANTFTYSLVTGTGSTDNAAFSISGASLLTGFVADQSTRGSYSVRVRVTDAGGLSTEQAFTITVTSDNVAPTAIALSATSIAEGAAIGTSVGSFSTTDPNASDTFTYALVAGSADSGNASFTIVGGQLRTTTALDFETTPSYTIRVRSTDAGGLFVEQSFTILVTNANESPTTITLSATRVEDGSASGTAVATLGNDDPDAGDTFTYQLVSGSGDSDNASFTINGTQLRTAFTADASAQDSYSVRLRVTDADGLFDEKTFAITVVEANLAPTAITLSGNSLAESAAIGSAIGTFSTTDPNATDTHVYTLTAGSGDSGNASFTIVGGQLQTATALDFEFTPNYTIRVRSTDIGGLFIEQTFTVNVTNVNEAPAAITISNQSIAEDFPTGTTVGLFSSTDQDAGDTQTYTLVSGDGDDNNDLFTISGDGLQTATALDFETTPSYTVRVRSADAGGLFVEQSFTITVTNVNEAPTTISLSQTSIETGAASDSAVGTLTSTDPDTGDTTVFSLVSGDGDDDNTSFTIANNQLLTTFTADQSVQDSYLIRLRVTDAGGLFTEQTFTITVVEPNVAPTAIELDNASIAEDAIIGTAVGMLTTTDANMSDTHTYTLVDGDGDDDNASFAIDDDQLITATALDFETKSSYTVRVRTTDPGGLQTEQSFAITVTNVNEGPTLVTLSNSTVENNAASGTLVGLLGNNDPDVGDIATYLLVPGDGDDDNASFTIDDNQLRTTFVADAATKSTYSIHLLTFDGAGLFVEQTLVITITEVNVAPDGITIDAAFISENAAIGTSVGSFTTSDPNTVDSHTYELASGDGDDDNASFTIAAGELLTATLLDFESKDSYTVRVRSTDLGGLTFDEVFTITVTDVNEAPTAIAISANTIDEDAAVGTPVGMFSSTDSDAIDMHNYELVSGDGDDDNVSFTIAAGELLTATLLDFETKDSYTVRVRSTDLGGLTFDEVFTITVTDVNEAPTALAISVANVAEAEPAGTLVGLFSSVDPDAMQMFTYTLVAGDGDVDNAAFTILNGELVTVDVFDMAMKDMYSVRVRTEDAGGLGFEEILNIMITDANVAPASIAVDSSVFPIDSPSGTVVATLTTTDANSFDTHTYRLVVGSGDDDNALFTIVGDTIVIAADIDYSAQTSFTIRLLSEDRYGLSVEQVFVFTATA